MTDLLLKRAAASPGEVYDVMCEERIVGRIMLSADAQFPWVWTLTYGYHEDRTPTHGYEATARRRYRRSPGVGTGNEADAAPPRSQVLPPSVKEQRLWRQTTIQGLRTKSLKATS
jgi:hypothetical protein